MPKKTKSIRKLAHDFVFNRIHRSQLIYNTCWEDPAIDRKLMRLNPESRVVMITSAGCNALDYLLDDPGEIHCIDVNPRQNALLHLKMAAIKRLSFEDFFLLFGCGCHAKIERIFSAVKYDMTEIPGSRSNDNQLSRCLCRRAVASSFRNRASHPIAVRKGPAAESGGTVKSSSDTLRLRSMTTGVLFFRRHNIRQRNPARTAPKIHQPLPHWIAAPRESSQTAKIRSLFISDLLFELSLP